MTKSTTTKHDTWLKHLEACSECTAEYHTHEALFYAELDLDVHDMRGLPRNHELEARVENLRLEAGRASRDNLCTSRKEAQR